MTAPTPAEVAWWGAFERVFPELYPAHGEHSLTCSCRGTEEHCVKKGTGEPDQYSRGYYNAYAESHGGYAALSAYYQHLAAAQQVD